MPGTYISPAETGFYYLNSRYYDPETGRFINADDVSYLGIGGILSYNLFVYCENDPINGYDPYGTFDLNELIGKIKNLMKGMGGRLGGGASGSSGGGMVASGGGGSSGSSVNKESSNFRSKQLLDSHYNKHGSEFGKITKTQYLKGANNVINSKSGEVLIKTRANGDTIYYNSITNEFAVMSAGGYIRTYFKPTEGIAYFSRM